MRVSEHTLSRWSVSSDCTLAHTYQVQALQLLTQRPHQSVCVLLGEAQGRLDDQHVVVRAVDAREDVVLVFEPRAHHGRLGGGRGQRGAVPDKLHSDEKPAS